MGGHVVGSKHSASIVWLAMRLLAGLVVLPEASAAHADDDLMSGKYPGSMRITRSVTMSGIVDGDLTVLDGAKLIMSGIVTGRLIVNQGGWASVSGTVLGIIENDGGHVEISGIYRNVNTFDGGDTRIGKNALQHPAATPVSDPVQAIGTMEQFRDASPVKRSMWALELTDGMMRSDPMNEFVIRPVREAYANDFVACIEAMEESASLLVVSKKCAEKVGYKWAAKRKKEKPDEVRAFLKSQAAAKSTPESGDATGEDDSLGVTDVGGAERGQTATMPNGKKVRLKDDGTYEVVGGEGGDNAFKDMSILDLKVDLKSLNGELVRTRGRGTYFGDQLILTDPNVDFDVNGILVSIADLGRDDRKWIVAHCSDGCSIVVEGRVDTSGFLAGVMATAIKHK